LFVDSEAYHEQMGPNTPIISYAPMFDKCVCIRVYYTCSYTSLNRETVQQKYRNRVSERSFSSLSMTVSAIIAQL